MELCVTKSNGNLVAPSGLIPSTMLDLSRIDRLPGLRFNARTLHVFEPIGPPGAAWSIIREALSKALVPYYPLAGRLSPDGSCIDCTGDGIWFVEATATCSLNSVGYFKDATLISFDDLLPSHPLENQGIDPLVLMQITEFDEGGLVMGLIFSHTICDGLGATQFLTAVRECARGVDPLTVTPLWHRNFIPPQPPSPTTIPPPNFTPPADYHLEQATIDIPLDQITQLKHKLMEESLQLHCSTFEVIATILWMNRTRAIKSSSESKTLMRLVFFADCRLLVSPPIPKGFYGNCFFPVTVTASNETLAQASIVEVVKMIQAAKARLLEEFSDWVVGQTDEDPFAPPLGYETLFITDWRRLGFDQVDYGSGPAVHVIPTQGSAVIPSVIVGSVPRPDKGVRLMT